MSCTECKYATFRDFGYSNYTVEGTDFECAKKLHPDGAFDRFYGKDKRLAFGNTCASKEAGEPIYLDVDGENFDELTDEQKVIWAMV